MSEGPKTADMLADRINHVVSAMNNNQTLKTLAPEVTDLDRLNRRMKKDGINRKARRAYLAVKEKQDRRAKR